MENPIEEYWKLRLDSVKASLEKNNFEVRLAGDAPEAGRILIDELIPAIQPESISWGGSMTFTDTGAYDELKGRSDINIIDTFDKTLSADEMIERRRHSLLVDLFITGTNAVTETGILVNLDMIGNRVAGLTFGPRRVVVFAGRNKIVPELDDAMFRIKDYAAPTNVMRLDKKNPCAKTATCHDCSSPERICNHWTITEKSFPKERIIVILINREMGL